MKFAPSVHKTSWNSPLGLMTLAATDRGLAGVWFDDQRHLPPDIADWSTDDSNPMLRKTIAQLSAYFSGQRRHVDLDLDLLAGTVFQQSVWQALLQIPIGKTTSYSHISQHIGKPKAMRAAGGAIGLNPVCIIVPCHRVLGLSGSLTGYAGGLHRKTALLTLEGAL